MRIKFDGRSYQVKRSDVQLKKFLDHRNVEYDYFFRFKEDSLYALIERPHKPGWRADFRIMTIHCFDKADTMVMNWTVCEGFLVDLKLLEDFPPFYNGPFFPTDFSTELGLYLNEGNKIRRSDIEPADLNMVVYWARFLGNMNMKVFNDIADYRKRFPDKKINVILVAVDRNTDWQEKF